MVLDAHDVFDRYGEEYEFWQEASERVATEVRAELREARIIARVEHRAKTLGSVVGKAYRKADDYETLDDFPDLAGVRVVVPLPSQVVIAVRRLSALTIFEKVTTDEKVPAFNELSYRAHHVDTWISSTTVGTWAHPAPKGPVRVEIQVLTAAQSAWATTNHPVTYKPGGDVDDEVLRRAFRLVSLVELLDQEMEIVARDVSESTDFAVALSAELEKYHYAITGEESSPADRHSLVSILSEAVPEGDRETYLGTLDDFVTTNRPRLTFLLGDAPRRAPIVARPEVIFVFERLQNSPFRLSSVWGEHWPPGELEELKTLWGPATTVGGGAG